MVIRWSILLCFLLMCFGGSARTIIVGGSSSRISIAEALTRVVDGDSIEVKAGTYIERNLMITKSVVLFSVEDAKIDGGGKSEDIVIIRSDGVCISGFQFVNVGASFLKEAAAIRLVRCKNVLIEKNKIDSCFFGIYIEYGSNSHIRENRITGVFKDEASAGNAIHAWKADSLSIYGNYTTGHRDGIYFEFVNHSRIEQNISKFNLRYGLHFMFSNDDSYIDNLFRDNGAGVAVMFSKNIEMKKNRFEHNWGGASYGLLLKEISDGRIEGNRFIRNTIGILAEGANRLRISQNEFILNGTALDLKGNCLDNRIFENNFVANTFELVTNTRQSNNLFEKNYWSNYSGYDLDKDGFGDVAYRPVSLFSKVIHVVPSAAFLLHSPFVKLIEMGEKVFPQYIPESLIDTHPKLRPYDYDSN